MSGKGSGEARRVVSWDWASCWVGLRGVSVLIARAAADSSVVGGIGAK